MENTPKILVTGGRGYIGAVLTPILLEQGFDVVSVDQGWFIENSKAQDFSELEIVYLSQFNVVIHLAGLSDDKLCNAFPEEAGQINTTNTAAFAQRCKSAGVERFLLASSSAVYGDTDSVATETHALNPQTLYAKTKVRAERDLIALCDTNFDVVCLRFGSGYGDSPEQRRDLVINRLASIALDKGEIGLSTDGECYRPFVHVEDMARALAFAAANDAVTKHNIYNVSHPRGNYKVGDVVALLAEATGAKLLTAAQVKDPRSYQVDTQRFLDAGFSYKWSLEEGIALLVRQLQHQTSNSLEQDRVQALRQCLGVDSQVKKITVNNHSIGSISPSVLRDDACDRDIQSTRDIVQNSRYRLPGAASCQAAECIATESQTLAEQRVITMRSGTDALVRALQVLGIKHGSFVAMPDHCFHAVAASVMLIGAVPVLVDSRSDDFNLDADALAQVMSAQPIDCVIAVDNYGTPSDWEAISAVAKSYGAPLIVDACESLGATRPAQRVVELADIVVISFSFTKPVHAAGMGGALIADKSLTQIIESDEQYLYKQIRLPEINAAYLVQAWPRLHDNINHLRDIYQRYMACVTQYGFTGQVEHGISTRIHAPFLVPGDWSVFQRDALIEELNDNNVQVAKQFQCQSSLLNLVSDCQVAQVTADRVLTLPSGGGMSSVNISKVISCFSSAVEKLTMASAV